MSWTYKELRHGICATEYLRIKFLAVARKIGTQTGYPFVESEKVMRTQDHQETRNGSHAMKTFTTCLTLALLSSASVVYAQCSLAPYGQMPASGYGVPGNCYGFGGPVAGHIRHSSTVQEGIQRGMAARIQAQAQYNLLTSLAALNMAQAERVQLENRQARIAVFRNQHASARNEQPQAEALAWPAVLKKPQYAGFRKLADRVAAKAAEDKATAGDWTRLQKAVKGLNTKLARENQDDAHEARQFVNSLLATNPANANQLVASN
jgi:hypothetical protein